MRALGVGRRHDAEGDAILRSDLDLTSTDSVKLSCIGLGVHAAHVYSEAVGREPLFSLEQCSTVTKEITLIDPRGCDSEGLEEASSYLEYLTKPYRTGVSLDCTTSISHINEAYTATTGVDALEKLFLQNYAATLFTYTSADNEYFLVITWSGHAVLGRGGKDSVQIPFLRSVVFAHTHPEGGHCTPSPKDLVSAADFLGEGGLLEVIAARPCLFIIKSRLPLGEDDYWLLHDTAKCLSKAKEFGAVISCLQSLAKLKTVEAYISDWSLS